MVSGMSVKRERSPIRGDGGGERGGREFREGRRNTAGARDRSSNAASVGSRSVHGLFVSNFPFEFRWQELKDLFRREVGEVLYAEVFRDPTGKSRCSGIIELESRQMMEKALDKMHRFEIQGRRLLVREERPKFRNARQGAGNSSAGPSPGGGRDYRDMPPERPFFGGGGGGGGGSGSLGALARSAGVADGRMMDRPLDVKYPNTYGLNVSFLESLGIDGPLVNRVFVANLDYKADERRLREVFSLAGRVLSVTVNKDRAGHSKGHAVVEYDHPVEAVQAISMLHNQNYMERPLSVHMDRALADNSAQRAGPDPARVPQLPAGLRGLGLGLGNGGVPLSDVANRISEVSQPLAGGSLLHHQPTASAQLPVGMTAGASHPFSAAAGANPAAAAAMSAAAAPVGHSLAAAVAAGLLPPSAGSMMPHALAHTQPVSMNPAAAPYLQAPAASQHLFDLQQRYAAAMAAGGDVAGLVPSSEATAAAAAALLRASAGGGGGGGSSVNVATPPPLRAAGFSSISDRSLSDSVLSRDTLDYLHRRSAGGSLLSANDGYNGDDARFNAMPTRGFCTDSIIISNLDPSYTWQTLRDKFREIGDVRSADIKQRGVGVVRFANVEQARRAVGLLDKLKLDGRILDVRHY